jgi:hypothetical protein
VQVPKYVQFIVEGKRLRVVSPKGLVLPDTIKDEIRHCKDEILNRLRVGGITNKTIAEVFPGAQEISGM